MNERKKLLAILEVDALLALFQAVQFWPSPTALRALALMLEMAPSDPKDHTLERAKEVMQAAIEFELNENTSTRNGG